MPLYDFKCTKCSFVFEAIEHAITTIKPCPKCPATRIEVPDSLDGGYWLPQWAFRQLSAPGGIRANGASGGMVLSEKQMKKIHEPVWQDEKTGKVTSAF